MSIELTTPKSTLKSKFFALKSPEDIADLLELKSYSFLEYATFVLPDQKKYTRFTIPKRNSGRRVIQEPIPNLKIIQHKLLQVLQEVYEPKPTVHGFVADRSIVTNAGRHVKSRYVFNIDLEHFFPSIHFGRVRGMFMAYPYNLDDKVATVLAQICCLRHNNGLPQGSPTSPIISNMLCAKMDSQLRSLAQKHHCHYTRYADDITFSTSRRNFPAALAVVIFKEEERHVSVGSDLREIIDDNGFRINKKKTRLQTKNKRQEVTGLTTNEFVNVNRKFIRQIRAMLHAWEAYGYDDAQKEYELKYWRKKQIKSYQPKKPSFHHVVKGKIEFLGMVRGRAHRLFVRFNNQAAELEQKSDIDTFLFKLIKVPGIENTDLEILELINGGENDEVEFKMGACLNPHNDKPDKKKMTANILEEVAAFLNSAMNGTVLIGVGDNKELWGVEREYAIANPQKANWDGYELFLGSLLNDSLSDPDSNKLFRISRHYVNEKIICAIRTLPSERPILAKGKLYIRSGSQSRELKDNEMVEYFMNKNL